MGGLPVAQAAAAQQARAADQAAIKLGTQFVEGCLAGVPGGGFCLPTAAASGAGPVTVVHTVAKTAMPQVVISAPVQQVPAPAPEAAQTTAYVPPHLPNTVPTIENVENIEPQKVHDLLQTRGCLLVDLRGEDRAAGLIDGAVHEPAIDAVPFPTKVPKLVQKWADQSLVVFTCQYSAHRAPQCANWYRQKANPGQRVAILSGGFRGWESMGLPAKKLG